MWSSIHRYSLSRSVNLIFRCLNLHSNQHQTDFNNNFQFSSPCFFAKKIGANSLRFNAKGTRLLCSYQGDIYAEGHHREPLVYYDLPTETSLMNGGGTEVLLTAADGYDNVGEGIRTTGILLAVSLETMTSWSSVHRWTGRFKSSLHHRAVCRARNKLSVSRFVC